ncbi:TolC family protein [Dokdonella immobilis]|uniref:Outer membrane protein, cobalt-zinc-cadmium efflux system n=1 Tax=Dokdonella immobilis TaxID=578942 RepID=A0A1I5AI62_9GAMM|nr:TolC family protein [Dokdonella immobilis]SFN62164.1 outer membrane protein, cobalt-zinc-cadmium efflux system [Dokdonella immobilis]
MLRLQRPRRHVAAWTAMGLALASTFALPARSEQTPATLAPAALRTAVVAAWREHPSFRYGEASLRAAQATSEAASQPIYNPELELSSADEGVERTTTAGLSLRLDIGGKRSARRDAARARFAEAAADAALLRRDFAKQWLGAWAEYEAAQERVEIGEHRMALVARFADVAQRLYAASDISGLERDLASLASDEARAAQAQLLADRADAAARFRAVGGEVADMAGVKIAASALPEPVDDDRTDRLPDWTLARARTDAAAREVAVARRERIADPSITAYAGRKRYAIGGPDDRVFGVTVSVPLFVRNSYRAEVVAAQAHADALAADQARTQIALEAESRRATESYAAARVAWKTWSSSPGTDVDRRSELLEKLWRAGEISATDYLLQLRQTLDTQLAGADLQARLWRSAVDYLAANGRLQHWIGLEDAP